jgi:hypothetical protein
MGRYSWGDVFMSYSRAYAFSTLAVVTVLALPADGQSVISTRSGVVHFFEGAVYLADKPLEPHLGKFPSMAKGAELRTAQGRAEVLLTPGVFLRMGEGSAIRMVANELSDTRVELLAGLAIVDSAEPSPGTSVTLIYRDWTVHFLRQGIYRIDSEPARLWVHQGKAEVSAGTSGEPIFVEQGMDVPFAAVLVPERSIDQPRDALDDWAEGRQQSISADNTIAANIQDPGSMDSLNPDPDSFTYFPMLGLAPLGWGLSSASSSLGQYQPGFDSIYLPGYTCQPLMLRLMPSGFGTPLHLPSRVGGSPFPLPLRVGGSPSPLPRPHVPPPTPVRPVPHVGAHVGVHR